MEWQLSREYSHAEGIVRYDVCGSGPPLVLVHGTPWSSFNWRHLIPGLASWYRVYYYDFIGYGQSEKRQGQTVSLGIQNQILSELLEVWQLDSPAIVGHDFGGATVLRSHLLDRRSFAKIVLIDPVALSPWGSPFFTHVRKHEAAFQGVPSYIHEALVSAYVQGATYLPMTAETLAGIVRPWLGSAGQAAFYRQIAQADRQYTDEVEPRYSEIACPVLILWGEQDAWIDIARGRQLHQAIPHSQFQAIANAGHLVQEDAPTLLLARLLQFLQSN